MKTEKQRTEQRGPSCLHEWPSRDGRRQSQQAAAAAAFAERWAGRGYEKGDTKSFWIELLTEVFDIETPASFIRFEEKVKVDKTNFIDAHIPSTKVLIEQKSLGKDLRAAITQSDGARLNPFQQAKRYAAEMSYSERPRWIVTCNFAEFLVYDMEQPNGEPESILLKDLGKEYYRLQFLVNKKSEHLSKEMEVSMQAGEIVGRIYEALLSQYMAPLGGDVSHVATATSNKALGGDVSHVAAATSNKALGSDVSHVATATNMAGETPALLQDSDVGHVASYTEALRWLNILCVRIVFCLYAEDAGVFAHDQFHNYLARYDAEDMRSALLRLFEVLNTPPSKRSQYLKADLKAFPYTNGGLFAEEIEIPQFTEELRQTLLQNASLDFDWSEISPTIFGAVFESTLNPVTRRSGGMHYTSIANIHKVIDPLFLNDLRREFNTILEEKVERQRNRRLDAFQEKLASLTFLDPACGSGNFLTETYLSLRRLENEVIRERYHGQTFLGLEGVSPVKVSINQFYGIEINDFAVTVATTALWISEAQMLAETERIIHHDIDFLPLKTYTNIREGNALQMDWLGGDVSHVATATNKDLGGDVSHVATTANKDLGGDVSHVATTTNMAGETPALLQEKQATLQFMERDKFIHVTGGKLPHWHQGDKVQFITFRLADSLPQERLDELAAYKEQWLAEHPKPWSKQTEEEYGHTIRAKIDKWLDNNYGSCLLKHESVRRIVTDSLLFGHGKSYWLHHFVIMPNHVHLLLTPIGDTTAEEAVGNIKKFTAHAINNALGRQGAVWQRMVFDRMVRDQQKYDKYVAYINNNPAHLPTGTYTIGGDVSHVATEASMAGETPALLSSEESHVATATNMAGETPALLQDSDVRHVASYDYIIGNPPFIGARQMEESQKQDVIRTFGARWKNVGNMDYVCCWYRRAWLLMKNSNTKTAFVSTNSICQGEQVANLWQPLMEDGLRIDFAYRTFRWDSESSQKAHVHCVIVGFSNDDYKNRDCLLFDNDKVAKVSHINAYLTYGPDVFIEKRMKPLCNVPQICLGGQPIDDGNLLLNEDERTELLRVEPQALPLIRPFMMGKDFISRRPRYCLWMMGVESSLLRTCHNVMERVQRVKAFRLASNRTSTLRASETPTLFGAPFECKTNYIAIPKVSSENRRYIPIDYLTPDIIPGDKLFCMQEASLYHFGVLTSNVHMAWMRAVCGRLKSDYSYSNTIVYNNFPWPLGGDVSHVATAANKALGGDVSHVATEASMAGETPALLSSEESHVATEASKAGETPALLKLRERIEQTAQAILDARALYPESSLADLYDELTMPPELRKAHQQNDRAVMQAYGFDVKTMTESKCVAELFKMYQQLCDNS